MRDEIEAALSPLVSKPLWGRARAADMEMFAFGNRVRATLGGPREVGEYMLHVQCPWRVRTYDQLIVGSDDLFSPADDVDDADFDWDVEGKSRRDRELTELFTPWDADPPLVEGVTADELGGAVIALDNGMTLELFPAESGDGEGEELWRLLPADDDHFVVTTAGVEPD
jgi:hypothetical protein